MIKDGAEYIKNEIKVKKSVGVNVFQKPDAQHSNLQFYRFFEQRDLGLKTTSIYISVFLPKSLSSILSELILPQKYSKKLLTPLLITQLFDEVQKKFAH